LTDHCNAKFEREIEQEALDMVQETLAFLGLQSTLKVLESEARIVRLYICKNFEIIGS
jgi:hypothetical protein